MSIHTLSYLICSIEITLWPESIWFFNSFKHEHMYLLSWEYPMNWYLLQFSINSVVPIRLLRISTAYSSVSKVLVEIIVLPVFKITPCFLLARCVWHNKTTKTLSYVTASVMGPHYHVVFVYSSRCLTYNGKYRNNSTSFGSFSRVVFLLPFFSSSWSMWWPKWPYTPVRRYFFKNWTIWNV